LVDFDDLDLEFGGVSCAFDVTTKYTIHDLASYDIVKEIDKTLVLSVLQETMGISVLNRPDRLLQANDIDPERIVASLDIMSKIFKHIVIDVSRINGTLGSTILKQADDIIIVLQPNVICVRNTRRIFLALNEMEIDLNRVKIVVNRSDPKNSLEKNIEKCVDAPILGKIPNNFKAVNEALNLGQKQSGENPIRSAVRKLVCDIKGVPQKEKPKWANILKIWRWNCIKNALSRKGQTNGAEKLQESYVSEEKLEKA